MEKSQDFYACGTLRENVLLQQYFSLKQLYQRCLLILLSKTKTSTSVNYLDYGLKITRGNFPDQIYHCYPFG